MSPQQFHELKSMISLLTQEQLNQIQREIELNNDSVNQELVTDEESDFIQSLFH